MFKKNLFDSLMIFTIGSSVLLFEYIKQNIHQSILPNKIFKDYKDNIFKISQKNQKMFLFTYNQLQINDENKEQIYQFLMKSLRIFRRFGEYQNGKQKGKEKQKQMGDYNLQQSQKDLKQLSLKYSPRLQKLKKWKQQTKFSQNYKQSLFISLLHGFGGLLFPTPFFISIFSYFMIYQINFVNDYFILTGKGNGMGEGKFDLNKINKLYFGLSIASFGILGLIKGVKVMGAPGINNNKRL